MSERLTLLVLANGGVGHTQRWVDYFVDRGDDVHLASLERGVSTRAREHPLRRLSPVDALAYPLAVPAVKRLAARVNPDVVVAHFVPNYGFIGSLVGRRPLVTVVWGSDILLNPTRTGFHRWRALRVLNGSDLVLTDARMLTDAVEALGALPSRMETLTFGIDTARYRPGDEPPSDPPVLLSYRQLLPLYHVDLLIRAVPLIRERTDRPFRVRIVGEGSERERLIEMSRELNADDVVTFVEGRLSDEELLTEIRRASVYVSTSRSDSTSVSLLEAMACGLPPVVTDIAGNREWITHGENGFLTPLERPDRLAEHVCELLDDPATGRAFAEINLRRVRAHGDWARNMEATRRLLVELNAGTRGSTR